MPEKAGKGKENKNEKKIKESGSMMRTKKKSIRKGPKVIP